MYAIVEISGKQFKVEKKQKLFVNRLDVAEGKKISFDNVLMVNDGSKSSVGTPNVSGVQVDAKVERSSKEVDRAFLCPCVAIQAVCKRYVAHFEGTTPRQTN